MRELGQKHGIHRIVVGLTSVSNAERAMAAAAVLAKVVEAQIVGLFVQEEDMVELAEFPFARVLDFDSPKPREVSRQLMQQAYTRREAICRQALSNHAGKARVNWSFSTQQGNIRAKVEEMAGSGDYVVLSGETYGTGVQALVRAMRMVPAAVKGVVVPALHREGRATGPIVAIDDGDEAGVRTVTLAASLARQEGRPLHLFVIAAADADADRIGARAADLTGNRQAVTLHRYLPGAPQSIAAGLARLSPFFVVADLDGEPISDDQVAISLFRAARAPVLLVRDKGKAS